MQESDNIGKRFAELKKRHNLTNEQLGEIAGVSYTAIGNIINGNTPNPGVSLIVKICIKLHVSSDWLLLGKEADQNKTNLLQESQALYYKKEKFENNETNVSEENYKSILLELRNSQKEVIQLLKEKYSLQERIHYLESVQKPTSEGQTGT